MPLLMLGTVAAVALVDPLQVDHGVLSRVPIHGEIGQPHTASHLYGALPSEQTHQSCTCTTLNFLYVKTMLAESM